MMRVLISGIGEHDPKNHHYMMVDDPSAGIKNLGFLIDLREVPGTLVDPAILQVEWGPMTRGGETRVGGLITRADGRKQPFFDKALIQPYIDAWQEKRAQILAPARVEVHRPEA